MADAAPKESLAADAPAAPAESPAYSMFRNFSNKTALFVSNASKRTSETLKSGTKSGTQGLMNFGTTASEGMKVLGTQAAAGGQYVWNATRQTTGTVVSRFATTGLLQECQRESKEAPCPRLLLLCCTALCSGALASEGLFVQDGPLDMVQQLRSDIVGAHCAGLIPPGTTPQVTASLVKQWLCSLQEPLLTFKLVPALTSPSTPVTALKTVLAELPAVNANALHVLLDTCNRVASNAAINDTDANALAAALAPCLLWKGAAADAAAPAATSPGASPNLEAPTSPVSPTAHVPGTALSEEELQVFRQLLAYIITNYPSFRNF